MDTSRTILHVDMDAFFASVEQLDRPELRGKPVLVGGTGRRGVVAAASYEARVFGCRSAMPSAVAKRLCPHAIFVKGSFARYRELSDRVMTILESFTPAVQPISIDEAFLDVTGSERLFGDGETIARAIRTRVKEDTALTCSVGVAPNKFLAKLGSDLHKPDGLTVITPERVHEMLDPLPVDKMMGVGPAAVKRLEQLGVRTIGDLRGVAPEALKAKLGTYGPRLRDLAHGRDGRVVTGDRDAKTIGHEQTFSQDLAAPDDVRGVMLGQCEAVGRRLRRHGFVCRNVTIKVRFGDFETITRSGTLPDVPGVTDATNELYRMARGLFDTWARSGFRPVRLIGVTAGQLSRRSEATGAGRQGGLFEQASTERASRADAATDAIVEKFGKHAVTRAAALGGKRRELVWDPTHNRRDTPE